MNKAFFILCIAIMSQFNSFSQEQLNDYKYIIVPTSYEFLGKKDKFQLNSLTKFLFNKYGYTAFLENEDFPEDLRNNRCLALTAELIKAKGGLLKTKVRFDLFNCDTKLVISSKIGESREKEYSKAYNLALRDAFKTFQEFSYVYKPNEDIISKGSKRIEIVDKGDVKAKEEIERLKKEVEALKAKEKVVKTKPQEVTTEKEIINESVIVTEDGNLLYAQPIKNGFQVIDTEPKKVMILLNSGVPNTFIVKGKDAIVYKKGTLWIYSENTGSNLKSETLNIKF
ncbi:hypothetical protein [Ichthyenterobacterium magnum]|uniref:Uncharacterized protein n=1 Tax=Ichthyenterobacterium magnum TaxID=1230530 RepID=A0A420DEY4_9FLAO|nr:hypothetical protein [Ichthyenterobacterium magnum]RKE90968.1 hypothetical protein BXY80_2558 [Ichthyenterobacterium magnum]